MSPSSNDSTIYEVCVEGLHVDGKDLMFFPVHSFKVSIILFSFLFSFFSSSVAETLADSCWTATGVRDELLVPHSLSDELAPRFLIGGNSVLFTRQGYISCWLFWVTFPISPFCNLSFFAGKCGTSRTLSGELGRWVNS